MVDDDHSFHRICRKAFSSLRFKGIAVEVLSAYSGDEARAVLAANPDLGVALIDVVMENTRAGLDLVTHIREERGDKRIRIILNTAFPVHAVEREVVERYEINDYRTKSELNPDRLCTVVIEALRNFDSLCASEAARREMLGTMTAVVGLFNAKSLDEFCETVLETFATVPGSAPDLLIARAGEGAGNGGAPVILAGRGRFRPFGGQPADAIGDPELTGLLVAAITTEAVSCRCGRAAFRIRSRQDEALVVCADGPLPGAAALRIFRTQAESVFDHLLTVEETYAVQIATIRAFAGVSGRNDHDAGGHLTRIERLSGLIAGELRARGAYPDSINDRLVEKIGLASVLHDIGMVYVPDDIVLNAEQLSAEEFQIINRHAMAGYRILTEAAAPVRGRNILRIAAEIARCHHERFDGTGYPDGIAGEAIPITARIVAVADVFDAMTSERPFRRAIRVDEALATLTAQAGKAFDPLVVEALAAVVRRLQAAEPEWFSADAGAERRIGGRGISGLIGRLFWPGTDAAAAS
ncbi:MAG: HD domain-containing phosphohydrolase [Rhodospirillaceae bacterium]